jgi:large subunit ribosomal protein L13e
MVKHNNVVPNVHQRKHWQKRVRTFFNQAAKKRSRLLNRQAKASKLFPRPLEALRPQVRGQTIRYNRRIRLGRGFSLAELKAVKITPEFAQTIGISVDHRRKNRSEEGLEANKKRLLAFLNKIVLKPLRAGKPKKGLVNDTESSENFEQSTDRFVLPLKTTKKREKPITTAELAKLRKANTAFRTLRLEWASQKYKGNRDKKKKELEEKEKQK